MYGEYKELERENLEFKRYYKYQSIVSDEEWDDFIEYLKKDLPSTFRIVGKNPYSSSVLEYVEKLSKYSENNDGEPLVSCLEWYPNKLAYEITKSRFNLKKSSGIAREFHSSLVLFSDGGCIFRQEAVSMLPVLFLDISKHHAILDMCSAPGSKTSQILEILKSDTDDKEFVSGFLVANDLDTRRAHMLIHHMRHLNSPSFVVTTHSADNFPELYIDKDSKLTKFLFDRILCDVPCSSDGTLRKNPNLFSKWNTNFGCSLHRLQRKILLRALSLIKPKGLIVYSTCSFNPIENEAVIASVITSLKKQGITVEIIDPKNISQLSNEVLNKIKYSHGISKWKVPVIIKKKRDKKRRDGNDINNISNIPEFYEHYQDVPNHLHESIVPSMFPPEDPDIASNLKKCIRIMPHYQNTGGFFIAILRLLTSLDTEYKKPNYNLHIQDDYCPLKDHEYGEEILKLMIEPYGLKDYNKDELLNHLLYRNPKGNFNKACNERSINKKVNDDLKNQINIKSPNENEDTIYTQDEYRYPRKVWLISKSLTEFLFKAKAKHSLRIIHAGFPSIELSRFRKTCNLNLDISQLPPLYRLNSPFSLYLYNQNYFKFNNTQRCMDISMSIAIQLLQTPPKPEDLKCEKEFHPFRIPRYMLNDSESPQSSYIFDLPGSVILRLYIKGQNSPIFLPAHVGRNHVELLLDKFLRFCIKFHLENIQSKIKLNI
ncbi:NOL1/NOP2/sun family protein [Cryptosporidium muris RN66]|uniref:NOL1/NOP2/sun family protein n=1 Tax=Cryptosporidium muris (strain RN66) TaxID=441375 RepID=B6ACG2_CRYMR|nr:NOL1/NOP2/sun family protein [Cryptosporidium muris RN66]EEA05816.1 NOL1/NOP2/sun family protein [Cryptosporidium muris RN66]|eukprot:XP_002140165.1 NOL1/NOP2/sun family protein [Cryptosporidium muris RN66]